MAKKLTKTETKRMLLSISGKLSKLMDSYFYGNRHQTLSDMKALQKMQEGIMRQYDKVK